MSGSGSGFEHQATAIADGETVKGRRGASKAERSAWTGAAIIPAAAPEPSGRPGNSR